MAEPGKPGTPEGGKPHPKDKQLPPNPVIGGLGAEPSPQKGLAVLVGYPGPARTDGFQRLYSDLSFSSYYDIPSGAIASWEKVNPDEDNSPLRVFVDGSADVTFVQTSSQTSAARFLQGSIAGSYLQGASYPAAGAGTTPLGFTTDIVCGITVSLALCAAKGGAVGAGLPTVMPPGCTHLPVLCAGGVQGGAQPLGFTTDIWCGIAISVAICAAKGGAVGAGLPTVTPPGCTHLPVLCAGGVQGGAQPAGFTTDIVCGITVSLALCAAKGGAVGAGLPTVMPPGCTLVPALCCGAAQQGQ